MVNIHPVISKVRNWGLDGSGATCNQTDNRYADIRMDQAENFIFDDYHEVKCQEDYIFKCLYPYRNSLSLKSKFKIMFYLGVFSFLLIVDLFDKNRKYPIWKIKINFAMLYPFCISDILVIFRMLSNSMWEGYVDYESK